jgi:hypothetical protein
MPFRREGPDDLIEHRNGELCEFAAARTVAPQNFAGQREGMHAFERGFFGARYCVVIKKRAGAPAVPSEGGGALAFRKSEQDLSFPPLARASLS